MKKIIKFGEITEDTEGTLVFKNFHIDFDHKYETNEEGILRMVIERLEIELIQLKISAQRQWVGLTDVEWMNIVNKDQAWFGQRPDEVAHEVAKMVEAKLKEKNT